MKTILLIFVGGGLGSVARYLIGSWITRIYPHPLPLGTLTVNIAACFLVGVFAGLAGQSNKDEFIRSAMIVGFCGGFSTFSAFTLDSAKLFNSGLPAQMVLYVMLSLVACTAATFLGVWLSR
jgi:fluoride exporter